MQINHYDNVIKGIHENIKKLWDPLTRDFYPIQIKTIYHQEDDDVNTLKPGQIVPNPADVRAEFLPAIFYEYGNARENDSIRKTTGQVGESIQLNVIASINGLLPPERSLVSRMSDMHKAIRMIVQESQYVGNTMTNTQGGREKTKKCRLGRTVSATRRQQNIGIMMFTLEFDIIQDAV